MRLPIFRCFAIGFLLTILQVVLGSNNINRDKDRETYTLNFRPNSEILYRSFDNNASAIELIKQMVAQHKAQIISSSGHIRIVAHIPMSDRINVADINVASIRGAVVRQWLRNSYPWISNSHVSFFVAHHQDSEALDIVWMDVPITNRRECDIFLSKDKNYPERVDYAIAHYSRIPFLTTQNMVNTSAILDYEAIAPAIKSAPKHREGRSARGELVTIHYRWDKDNLDKEYLTNTQALHQIDSIVNLKNAALIDSIIIVSYASPEGPIAYNKRLSQRRANTLKKYMTDTYPQFSQSQFSIEPRGENWVGLRLIAESDPSLPMKEQVLSIVNDSKINDVVRQKRITQLDQGRVYKDYILPNYYRYLRTGASLLFVYKTEKPIEVTRDPIDIQVPEPQVIPSLMSGYSPYNGSAVSFRYIRPLAVKTNLLFDAATLFNIELEFPVGRNFSILAEWIFPFWGGLGNAGGVAPLPVYSESFTLQMLAGGVEARYWFTRGKKLHQKAQQWGDYNPLNGWFIGLYGGAGLFDFQFGKQGMQGDFYIASGISAGFAHPIAKHFHLEYAIGVGYFATTYYNYSMMEGHKVVDIRPDGRYDRRQQSFVGPTKLKVSLVWIPQFKIKNRK